METHYYVVAGLLLSDCGPGDSGFYDPSMSDWQNTSFAEWFNRRGYEVPHEELDEDEAQAKLDEIQKSYDEWENAWEPEDEDSEALRSEWGNVPPAPLYVSTGMLLIMDDGRDIRFLYDPTCNEWVRTTLANWLMDTAWAGKCETLNADEARNRAQQLRNEWEHISTDGDCGRWYFHDHFVYNDPESMEDLDDWYGYTPTFGDRILWPYNIKDNQAKAEVVAETKILDDTYDRDVEGPNGRVFETTPDDDPCKGATFYSSYYCCIMEDPEHNWYMYDPRNRYWARTTLAYLCYWSHCTDFHTKPWEDARKSVIGFQQAADSLLEALELLEEAGISYPRTSAVVKWRDEASAIEFDPIEPHFYHDNRLLLMDSGDGWGFFYDPVTRDWRKDHLVLWVLEKDRNLNEVDVMEVDKIRDTLQHRFDNYEFSTSNDDGPASIASPIDVPKTSADSVINKAINLISNHNWHREELNENNRSLLRLIVRRNRINANIARRCDVTDDTQLSLFPALNLTKLLKDKNR
ncbi:hypothetical protein I6I68_00860 [Corynebacterium glucuronolyticum]|uniref:hypothetical protein n=1 Tax=Corynebacterium glucuronolyticum TaxID=39791 RepID=UPI00191E2224|nr:hypothetical protein [Corynebacterium glucuronolyticum]QQU88588.1 hypothetical protein I6I68_00860 [Corynebacterium glucuronolyticum]